MINWDGGLTVNDLVELHNSLVKPIGKIKCIFGFHDWDWDEAIVHPIKKEIFTPCRRCKKYKISPTE